MGNTKLILLLAVVACASSNDLTVGHGDRGNLIFRQIIEANPAIWRQIDTVVINATEGEVISKINITDLRPEKDGEAKIIDGGVGLKDVTIELRSPTVLRGYSFKVQVFSEAPSARGISTTEKANQDNKHPSVVGDDVPNFDQPRTNIDATNSHGLNLVSAMSSTTESLKKYSDHSSRNTRDAVKAEHILAVADIKDGDKEQASATSKTIDFTSPTPAPRQSLSAKDAKPIEAEAKSSPEIPFSSTPKLTTEAPKTNLDAVKTTPYPVGVTPEATTKHSVDHKRDTKEATEKPVKVGAVNNVKSLQAEDAKTNDTEAKSLTDVSTATPLGSTNAPKTNLDAAKTTPVIFSHEATTKHSADHKRDTKEAADKPVKLPASMNDKNLEAKGAKTNDAEAKSLTDLFVAVPTMALGSTEAPKISLDATNTTPHPVGVTPETTTKHNADHKRDTKETSDKLVKVSASDFTTEAAKEHENIDVKLKHIKSDSSKVNTKPDSTTKQNVELKMNEDTSKKHPKATGTSEKDLNTNGAAPVIDDFGFEAQLTLLEKRNKDTKTKAFDSDIKHDAPETNQDSKNDAKNSNKNGPKTKDDIENNRPYPYLSRAQNPSENVKLESTTKHSEHKRDTKDHKHKENNPKESKEDKMEKSDSKTVDEVKNASQDKKVVTAAESKPIVSLQ